MDDQKFDQQTAAEWIGIIESAQARSREKEMYPALNRWSQRTHAKEILDVGIQPVWKFAKAKSCATRS